jgi:hypothetical protein
MLAEIQTQHLLNRSLERFHDNLLNKSSSICLILLIFSPFLPLNHLFRSVHFLAPHAAAHNRTLPPSGAFSIVVCALRVAESLAQELELERKSRQQQQQQQQQQADRDVKSPLQGEGVQ